MTATGLFPRRVHLDERLEPGFAKRLEAKLAGLGVEPGRGPSGSLTVSTYAALQDAAIEHLAILFDGKLGQEHSQALRRTPPALLLACRAPDGALAEWELGALAAFVTGDSLVPATGLSREFPLRQMPDIENAAAQTETFVRAAGGGSYPAAAAADVMHELAANALLDAPTNPDGSKRYAHRRHEAPTIAPEDAARARIVVSGEHIYLQAADRFGGLGPEPVAAALSQQGGRVHLNPDGGGAGLGILRMVDQSDLTVFRVARGRRCEVTCVVSAENVRRRSARPKSIWFLAVP